MRKGNLKSSQKYLVIGVVCMGILFTGCGNTIPDMTAEQQELISQYAANLLISYDSNQKSRLVDLTDTSEESTPENTTDAVEEVEGSETLPEESESQEQLEENTENSAEDNTESITETESQEVSYLTIAEVLNLPENITLEYKNVVESAYYPIDQTNEIFFSLDASAGNSLLVYQFVLKNQSQEDVYLDFFSQDISFRLQYTDGSKKKILTTLLDDDLATFVGDIYAGESLPLVIIVEVTQSEAQTLSADSLTAQGTNGTGMLLLK